MSYFSVIIFISIIFRSAEKCRIGKESFSLDTGREPVNSAESLVTVI